MISEVSEAFIDLANVIGRSVDVHQDLSTRQGLFTRWSIFPPDVLTDRHSGPNLTYRPDTTRVSTRHEVAVFIEDPVVRKEDLVVDAYETSVPQQRGSIGDLPLHRVRGATVWTFRSIHEPDDGQRRA